MLQHDVISLSARCNELQAENRELRRQKQALHLKVKELLQECEDNAKQRQEIRDLQELFEGFRRREKKETDELVNVNRILQDGIEGSGDEARIDRRLSEERDNSAVQQGPAVSSGDSRPHRKKRRRSLNGDDVVSSTKETETARELTSGPREDERNDGGNNFDVKALWVLQAALVLARRGSFALAIQYLSKICCDARRDRFSIDVLIRAFCQRSTAFTDSNDLANAERDALEVLKLDGNNFRGYVLLGSLRFLQERWKDAVVQFRKALDLCDIDHHRTAIKARIATAEQKTMTIKSE